MRIQLLTPGFIRIIPQDILVLETVRLGEIDAREAYTELILDAEILVDEAELKKIAGIPEVAQALAQITSPETPQYKPQDWRAKMPVMREVQWKKKPIIDYIANSYKNDVIQAARDQFKSVPADWVAQLFEHVEYRLEPKALQLSPSEDKKWKSVFVQLIMDLGSAEDYRGFLGKFAKEIEDAAEAGKIADAEKITVNSSLVGLDTALKALDPYAGAKLSSTKISGHDIADEPGYDKEIRSGFYDRLAEAASVGLSADVKIDSISDNGQFVFSKRSEPTYDTPEDIADQIDEV